MIASKIEEKNTEPEAYFELQMNGRLEFYIELFFLSKYFKLLSSTSSLNYFIKRSQKILHRILNFRKVFIDDSYDLEHARIRMIRILQHPRE